ncbi:MAG TPA: alkaline phosphatase family protein [Blastocatellia bacterium]|nr:alkaline phosphatase family protein [Blastocatellia bacterium]
MLKDFGISVSLANLCFIEVWSRLITKSTNPKAQYLRYSFQESVAVIINVLLVATAIWLCVTLVKRSGSAAALRVARWLFIIGLLVAINGFIHTEFPDSAVDNAPALFDGAGQTILVVAILCVTVYLLARFLDRVVKVAAIALLLLLPFAAMTFGQTVWHIIKFSDKHPGPLAQPSATAAPRVVWLVFDEMDQKLAFDARPASLKLPELDRLRAESIYAANAYPPAGQTLLSLPSLITGRFISGAEAVNPSELMITFEDSQTAVSWGAQPNVFSRAREAGFNTSLVGWYHPYCRIIGEYLDRCVYYDVRRRSWAAVFLNQAAALINTVPFVASSGLMNDSSLGLIKREEGARKQNFLGIYLSMLDDAKRLSADASVGLVLIHWSIPHSPNIYDSAGQELTWNKRVGYLDNLALVDRTVGEMRQEMERAGVWEDTVLLITSDHSLRGKHLRANFPPAESEAANESATERFSKPDPRVPFVLKLGGKPQPVTYEPGFNTVITQDLLLALLRRELTGAESVTAWLEKNRSVAESPYKRNRER